jgi:hypothetical protein
MLLGRAVAQAVSRQPLTTEGGFATGSVRVGFVVDKVVLARFSRTYSVFRSTSFHRSSTILTYLTGMNNRPIGGRSSET